MNAGFDPTYKQERDLWRRLAAEYLEQNMKLDAEIKVLSQRKVTEVDERREFELWVAERLAAVGVAAPGTALERNALEEYVEYKTKMAWDAWQHRAALCLQRGL
jgi:GTP-binding protein EngB required for normal cell division